MDRADLDTPRAREVCSELDALVVALRESGLQPSNWYGGLEGYGDDGDLEGWERANRGLPWFLYWEIAWLDTHNDFQAGQRLLDLGGSSSLFSCYMAARGLDVVTVDLDQKLIANADVLAAETGWSLRNLRMDLRDLDEGKLGGGFDHVTSICVFEHIPLSGRIDVSRRIRRLLADGGSFSITFDYMNPSRMARIGSPADVEEQFVAPSGLQVRGNRKFHDTGRRYLLHPSHHPSAREEGWAKLSIEQGHFEQQSTGEISERNDYTFGALFCERGG